VSTDIPLEGYLFAYLDAGIAPVTAEEARSRGRERAGGSFKNRGTRRNTLPISIGFAVLLAIGVVAAVYTTGSHKTPTAGSGDAVIARLAPAGNATSEQLDSASSILVRRLNLIGVADVEAHVSGGEIIMTARGAAHAFQMKLSSILAPGDMLFRPVLCAGPAYRPSTTGGTEFAAPGAPLPTACPTRYQLTAANLDVDTNTGQPQGNVPPWPALANYPSTNSTMDSSSSNVLLPSGSSYGFADERLLLGPAQMSDIDISSASVASNTGDFMVDVDLTPAGGRDWDALADEQFHAYAALDLDGTLISVPLSEPSQSAFSSFGGKVQISGGFTKATAEALVVDLESGPLPVVLRVVSTGTTDR
jgi:hypothetical protein